MRNHRRTVALFGSSSRGQQCRALLQTHPVFDLLCFFDNNPDKWGTTIDGLPVLRPDAEAVEAVDFILIASMYVYEIHAQLEELGVGSKIALSVPDLESRLRGPAPGGGNETTRTSGPSPDPASAETAEAVGRFIDRWRAGAAGDGERTAVVSAGTAQFGPVPAPDLVACTVCSNNYIGYATVLARSFLRHHPRARFVLCLTDRRHQGLPYPDLEDSRIEVIEAESLGIPEFERSAFRYGPVELNCAVKPFLLDWLFAARSAAKVIYLDPDILVLDTLQPLVDLLDRHAIALVPHITSPYLDDRSPSELDLLQVGTFNLGFIALRSADQSRSFLAWWQSRVHRHGAIDTSRGIFVDQKWIDLVPSLFADHVIVRDPGYDVAYWNLHEREVTFDGDRFQVNGQPLRFYHFSGFDARCTDDVSKFQNRIALPDRGPLRILFEIYRRMVIEAGHLELAAAPYAYGRFSNDVTIGRAVRRAFSVAPAGAFAGSPFDVESDESLFAWLNQPVRPGSPLTHLLASIRDNSPELRAAFGANDPESERRLADYIRLGARVHGLDASFFSHLEPHRQGAGASQPSLAAEQPLVEAPAAQATEGAAPTCGSAPRLGDAEPVAVTPGVNIVGYLDESTGVGELARGLVRAFRLAGVPVAEVGLDAGGSLRRSPAGRAVPNPHSTNIVCVNADQVGRVAEVVGRQFFAGRFNVGYWAWELPEFPRHWRSAFDPFDEIWAPSRFVKDAVAKVAPIPVTVVPPALAPVATQAAERAALGLDTDAIVFLAMFDHRSFAERKNPLGAIEAFGRAFGSGEGQRPGVQLVIKAGGASFAPSAHEKVEAAAEAVSARLLTAPMTRDEVNGLVAAADCFVSLHRSEGFGLPLAEAMGAGKPVIATDYPANAEFQTPDNSLLVAAGRRVLTEPVGPYPRGAVWAEPDIDQAASWMRWVADHPADARQIGARAAADVRRQFSARAVAQVAIERLRQATSDSWWDRFLPVGPDSGPADDVPTASSQEQRPTAGPLVNVVLADTGWILERCARELESRLPYVRVASAAEPTAAINYYMNYSAWRGEPAGRKAAFFTHVEERVPEAARRFFDVAREMDVAVAMSDRYADQLRQAGVGRVEVIVPGVDLQRFRPSLRIGVVGRTYHTGRKGEDLVRAVMGTPHIEWHFTGEGWPGPAEMVPADRMPDFYRSMDYILVPADYEGGPMPLLEALASGVEVIAPPIGFVPDYPHIEYETGSADSLRAVLERLTATRLALRSSVERRTWDQWALDHDRVFRSLVEPARVPTPEQVRSRQAGPREDRSLLAANCEAGPRPAKPAGPAGPAGPMVAEAARLRVLLALHAPETRNMMGGPAVRLPAMREALAEFGVEADITTDEACETGGYDLVHVFNVWEPESALRQLRHVRSTGVPVVFSPIYMPLDEVLWAQSALPQAAAGPGGADAIARRIAEALATARERRVPPPDVVTRTRLSDYPSLVREMLEAADLVIGLSQFELARLAELNNGKERATALVPNGTELEAFRGADPRLFAEKYGVADYVLSVGRIEPRKNQLLLVRALADTGLPIVLVGHTADPAYASLVRQQSGGRLVLTGRLGHRDPLLASAFAGAKAFALPSWAEGAPLGALEAAAAGVPLALSDRSGEREYFGDLASYADPGDPGSIRRAVEEACRRLTEDPEHREKLRALIRRSYTWRHAAEATAVAYRRAIAAHRANRRNSVTAGTTGIAPSDGIRRLEIGSGDEPQDGYEHLDSRPDLPHVEHVCDIRKRLPFPDGHWDELLSRSCLEHVSWREAPAVLAEWARVLKPGGSLDLWVPDLSYLCRRYLAGRPDEALDPALRADATRLLGADDVSTWALLKLFGGQEYPENLHGGAFDFDMLARLLDRAGFTAIERREPYYGLHVVARRSDAPPSAVDATTMLTTSATPASAAVKEQRLPLPVHVRWGAGVFNYSGYAALCRSVILDLDRAGVPVEIQSFDQEGAERDRFVESLAGSERWKRLMRQRVEQGVYLCCHTPAPWDGGDSFFGRRRQNPGFHAYVGLTMFESDRLPHGWAAACDSMDEIWVPSEFNRETFARGGVEPSKLHVLPVGIDTSAYDPDRIAPFEIPGRRSFCFLSVFQWTRRKGWDVLLDAYARAFTNADDVSLVIRASLPGASAAPPIREQIARHFERLGVAPSRAPHVIVLDRPMPDGSMPSLYRAADAFVLPTRGEGWGLPFMEAMASGLPTIATRWSAHLDFMHDRNSYLIDIDGLVPVERAQTIENPFYGADHKWASPSVADTARLLRHVFDNRAEARGVGRRARSEIRSRWTPARTAEWIGERVEARVRANPQRIDRMQSVERAREAQARGLTTEAMRRYQEAATVGGRWLLAAYNLASLCREVGDSRRARDLFAEIASKSGSVALRSGARFHLAWLALDEGRLDEAQPLLEACLAEAPEHQRAAALRWLVLGRAAEVAGRLDEAVGLYERAHETSPEWDRAAYNFGSALKRAGRKDQARILFSQVMRTSAVSQLRAAAHFHTAELIDETGDRQSAAGHLESCLIENPGHVRAAELLAAWTGEPAAAGAATKS